MQYGEQTDVGCLISVNRDWWVRKAKLWKKKKKWLKNFELEEMQECESVEDQWLLQLDEEEKNVFVKDFRVVVENLGNIENVEYVLRIKEDLLEEENEMLKSKAEILKEGRARLPSLS